MRLPPAEPLAHLDIAAFTERALRAAADLPHELHAPCRAAAPAWREALGAAPAQADALGRAWALTGRADLGLPAPDTAAGALALERSPLAADLLTEADTSERIHRLPADARDLLLGVCHLSGDVPLDDLGRLAPLSLPSLFDAVEHACRARLLLRHPSPDGTRFALAPPARFSAARLAPPDVRDAAARRLLRWCDDRLTPACDDLELDEPLAPGSDTRTALHEASVALARGWLEPTGPHPELRLRLLRALLLHAHQRRDLDLLQAALRASNPDDAGPPVDDDARTRAALHRARALVLAAVQGPTHALPELDRAHALRHADDDPNGPIRAACIEAVARRTLGDAPAAFAAIERAESLATLHAARVAPPERARLAALRALLVHTFRSHADAAPLWHEALHAAHAAHMPGLHAFIHLQLGNSAWRDSDLDRAVACLREAERAQRALGDDRGRATTCTGLASALLDLGRHDEALDRAEEAAALHRASGQTMPAGLAGLVAVRVALDRGDEEDAQRRLVALLASLPPSASSRWRDRLTLVEALAAWQRGFRERALEAARRLRASHEPGTAELRIEAHLILLAATRAAAQEGDANERHTLEGDANEGDANEGDANEGDANERGPLDLLRAIREARAPQDLHAAPLLGFAEGFAREALGLADEDVADRFADAFHGRPGRPGVRTNARLRFWARHLERTFPPALRAEAWARALDPNREGLVLDGPRLRPPGAAAWADLSRRVIPLRLLGRLVDAGDAAVSDDALVATGWPGERMTPSSASMRLQRAVSDLRSLGLGAVVERAPDGYRLSPRVKILRVPASFEAWYDAAAPHEAP